MTGAVRPWLVGWVLLTAAAAWARDAEEARLPDAAAAVPGLDMTAVCALLVDAVAGAQSAPARAAAARDAGAALWEDHRQAVQAGSLDDRPLYWERLAAREAFRESCDLREDCESLLHAFERSSRGIGNVTFSGDPDMRIALSGFDPFNLDDRVDQSNPSGLAALSLDGVELDAGGIRVRVEAMMLPVRFEDFDAGLVESAFQPILEDATIDALITISMGRKAFDLERFPGRRRSATAPDNLGVRTGASAETPLVPRLHGIPLPGPEFVEFSLPVAAMLTVQEPFPVQDNRWVTTLERGPVEAPALATLQDQTAVAGSGGGYLSNEVSFRTVRLAAELGSDAAVGHVHTPRVTGYDAATEAAIVDQLRRLIGAAARGLSQED